MPPIRPILLAVALSTITACDHAVQTSSGAEYLAARSEIAIDPEIARAAAIEPALRFPARIGVARIVNAALTQPPAEEIDLLEEIAARHPELGEFVTVSPLIMAMVKAPPPEGGWHPPQTHVSQTVADIRRAAARQHLDYVLVYEIGARSRTGNTPFALADITLIGGAILPTRSIRVTGVGQALFLDVRNGYPYGTAQATETLTGLGRSFGTQRSENAVRDRAVLKTATALAPAVDRMLVDLSRRAGS